MAVTPISPSRAQTRVVHPPALLDGRWLQRILLANLAAQVLIVFSGGIVRLTGSGLGCPTFPQCVPGSYVPVVTQPQGFHKYIEFGNRMLTFVVTVLAVAALVAVVRYVRAGGQGRVGRRRLLILGVVPFVGVLAQALIGGISVLTKLNPAVVATHFLVSMSLIAASTVLWLVGRPGPGLDAGTAGRSARLLAAVLALVTVALLVLGTLVTGSGPHSGDADEHNRFGFDIPTVARLHSSAVWVFVLVLLTLMVVLRRSGGPLQARRWALILLAVTVVQAVIGYVQYALAVPIGLVAAHLLGASLLVVATTATAYGVLSAAGERKV